MSTSKKPSEAKSRFFSAGVSRSLSASSASEADAAFAPFFDAP